MAREVYSLRIFASGGLSVAAGQVGPIVPAGFVYVVRDIDALELTGVSGGQLQLISQVGTVVWFAGGLPGPAAGNWSWRGRQVYNEGEQVGFKSGAGTWSMACSGYQLTLP